MRAAAQALRAQGLSPLVVAVPIAPPETCDRLREEADEVICAVTPELFYSVGAWYEDFTQSSDENSRGCSSAPLPEGKQGAEAQGRGRLRPFDPRAGPQQRARESRVRKRAGPPASEIAVRVRAASTGRQTPWPPKSNALRPAET